MAAGIATALPASIASLPAPGPPATRQPTRSWRAVEITLPPSDAEEAILVRPVAVAVGAGAVYIADAQDCAVKVFSRDGAFVRSIGKKGQGPGEFSFPSGVCAFDGRVHVADKFNRRIQALDPAGRPCGGFTTPFAPDKVFALHGGTLLITSNPTGRPGPENLLHIYAADGRALWEGLEARRSSDPVYDAFQNMVVVCPAGSAGFFVIHKCGERGIRRFAADGTAGRTVPVDERFAFRPVDLPFRGPQKRLLGFCWAAAFDGGLLYLSAPEPVDDRDLGPGRQLSVLDEEGRLAATLDLPSPVHRFVVADGRIFAVDDEGGLRIFEVVR